MPPIAVPMIRSCRPTRSLLLIVLLAGCGGGGGGAKAPMAEDPPVPSRPAAPDPAAPDPTTLDRPDLPDSGRAAEKRAEGSAFLARYADPSDLRYSTLSSLPTRGSTDYAGYFYGDISDGGAITQTLIGDMVMEVDWTASSVDLSGRIDGVLLADDTELSGALTISGGSLDRDGDPSSDFTLGGLIDGRLSGGGEDYVFSGNPIEGDFLGERHDAAGGEVLGKVTVDGDERNFDGGFILAR